MGEGASTQHRVIQWIEGAEAHCELDEPACFQGSPRYGFGPGARINPLRIVWADGGSALEPPEAALQVAFEPECAAHGEIDERVDRVELAAARREPASQCDFTGAII